MNRFAYYLIQYQEGVLVEGEAREPRHVEGLLKEKKIYGYCVLRRAQDCLVFVCAPLVALRGLAQAPGCVHLPSRGAEGLKRAYEAQRGSLGRFCMGVRRGRASFQELFEPEGD